jgi:putative ABC transport system permease protein
MLRHYLLLAWKVLGRRRLFTAISLFGVGFTLLILLLASTLLDHVFAPQTPERRFDQVLGVWGVEIRGERGRYQGLAGYALLAPLGDLPGVAEMGIFSLPRSVQTWVDGRQLELAVKRADRGYWRILDFPFLAGGPWNDDEDRDGRPVAVVTASTARRILGSEAAAPEAALGHTLELDGRRFGIVGVVPDVPILRLAGYAEVWVPLTSSSSSRWREEQRGNLVALFLARDRSAMPQIAAEVRSRLAAVQPTEIGMHVVRGGAETMFAAAARFLLGDGEVSSSISTSERLPDPGPPVDRSAQLVALLVSLGLLFMALPAVNLANIHYSRIRERATEIGVRRAFGAPTTALLAQFLVENLVLTLLGGLLGLLGAVAVLAAVGASGAIPYADFAINWRIALWGLAAAVVFALLSGVYPAWRMSRVSPVSALRGRS